MKSFFLMNQLQACFSTQPLLTLVVLKEFELMHNFFQVLLKNISTFEMYLCV